VLTACGERRSGGTRGTHENNRRVDRGIGAAAEKFVLSWLRWA
jgi:hypothetical protein